MSTTGSSTNNFNGITPVVVPATNSNNGRNEIEKRYPTTQAQLEVWLASHQSTASNCAYNEISSLFFEGQLDADNLRKAIDQVVERHASLRSTFSDDGSEVLVHKSLPYDFQSLDFTSKADKEIQEAIVSVVQNESRTPFDLVKGPLLRVVLQKTGPQSHKLTVSAHHIVLDGWSLALFCNDLGFFYDSLSGKIDQELPTANSYDHYAKKMSDYLASGEGKTDEAFWVDQFSDVIPVLDLPTEKARPSLRTYYGRRYDHTISNDLAEQLRKVGAKSGCSLFNIMLAAFNAYVARISGNDDFCIGIPTAGQAAIDQPNLIGMCVNTMPLRTKINIDSPFSEYMKTTRATLLDAFDHQKYSYGTLLRKLSPPRDPSRPPMLSVSFNIDPVIDTSDMGFTGLDVDVVVEPRSFENFEWFINGVIQKDKSIEFQAQYNADLYTAQSMQFYFEGFEAFLEGIATDSTAKISDLKVMSIPQRQKVIVDWNTTEMEYPVTATLHSEFSRQAQLTPNKTAVVFGETSLTYAEVESRSNQIARYLTGQGVSAGDLVGICVERSIDMLVNLYGIMKTGAGYVPLDPAYPVDRLQYMCDHSKLKLVVTEESLLSQVATFGEQQIAIDTVQQEIEKLDSGEVENSATPEDICYVIYTSGSTGKPKGVQVPHGCVVNFLYSMQKTPGFATDESVLAVTTLSFDIAVLELYLPTISGGKVVLLDSEGQSDGVRLAEALIEHDITLMQATPATWRLMIQSGWTGKDGLKVLCGGEPMPQDLVGPLLSRCGELWNMYGPTETTVWSAAYQITNENAQILIGKPIGNTQIFILDQFGNEVPVGCAGEVFIGGAGVTLGYRNRQDLTDERFVKNRYRNPFVDYVSDKLYKTGDLARYRFDGNIQFLRRNDKQVKVRGFRIELGEIEQAIKTHPAVEQVVAIVREDTPGDTRLVSYCVTKPGQSWTASDLRNHLSQSLPYYMVPQHFVELDSMPQTNNGNIDFKALPAPNTDPADSTDTEITLPETEPQKYLASVWQEVLDTDDVGINDTFFEIGGHSLLVMKAIKTVHEKTGIKLSPQDFLIATLEQMAQKIETSYVFKNDTTEQANVETSVQLTEEIDTAKNDDSATKPSKRTDDSKTESSKNTTSTGISKILKGFWN